MKRGVVRQTIFASRRDKTFHDFLKDKGGKNGTRHQKDSVRDRPVKKFGACLPVCYGLRGKA
jgi:hypothetical protein